MKIRHRTGPIAATRAQTVRQSLHSGQVRAHTRTNRMVLLCLHVLVVLLLLLTRPRVSLVVLLRLLLVVAVVRVQSIRMILHLVWMLVVPRMPAVEVMVLVVHAQRVQGMRRGFASGCIGQAPDLGLRCWKGHPTVAACLVF